MMTGAALLGKATMTHASAWLNLEILMAQAQAQLDRTASIALALH